MQSSFVAFRLGSVDLEWMGTCFRDGLVGLGVRIGGSDFFVRITPCGTGDVAHFIVRNGFAIDYDVFPPHAAPVPDEIGALGMFALRVAERYRDRLDSTPSPSTVPTVRQTLAAVLPPAGLRLCVLAIPAHGAHFRIETVDGTGTWPIRLSPRNPGRPGLFRWSLEGMRAGEWDDEQGKAAERYAVDLVLALVSRMGVDGEWEAEGVRPPYHSIELDAEDDAVLRQLAGADAVDGRIVLELRTPSQCQQACIFCVGNRDGPSVPVIRSEPSERTRAGCDILLAWLASRQQAGPKVKIVMTSSDPLNSPLLEPMLKGLSGPGLEEVFIMTPGTRMAEPGEARWLAGFGLPVRLLMTLHGPGDAVHDLVAGRPGAFRELLDALRNCRDAGLPVELNHVVVRENVEHLPETLRTALRLGFRPCVSMFLPVPPIPEATARRNMVPFATFSGILEAHRDLVLEAVSGFRHVPECILPVWARHLGADGFIGRPTDSADDAPAACRACTRFRGTCMGPTRPYLDCFGAGEFRSL